ncbi:MAG: exodeoxyribonuclease VII small subunit, partial [Holosporaceae bacterium]|jgi:exodeoxyribonuclease VII small subunit|nr:exodeoxyribonuclease VII small subunit [Holosporaceae bacterium]
MVDDVDINQMEFEQAMKELENIVKILEEGKSPLKESVNLYERGAKLKKHCDNILESAQLRINQISLDRDGLMKQTEVDL